MVIFGALFWGGIAYELLAKNSESVFECHFATCEGSAVFRHLPLVLFQVREAQFSYRKFL
jgi:hypothetical protein